MSASALQREFNAVGGGLCSVFRLFLIALEGAFYVWAMKAHTAFALKSYQTSFNAKGTVLCESGEYGGLMVFGTTTTDAI